MTMDAEQIKAATWRAAKARIRRCDPGCLDECDLCAARDDFLADLDEPMTDAEFEAAVSAESA